MAIKIFTIPFDAKEQVFNEEDLQAFLVNKKITAVKSEFFQQNGNAFWTVFIDFEPVFEKKQMPVFSEPERILYEKLQQWRKSRAETDGLPVFLIATNSELAQLVSRAPKTLDGLAAIKGFGKKKCAKYGKDILKIINSFYERKDNRS